MGTVERFGALFFGMAALLALAVMHVAGFGVLAAWLVAVSVVTVIAFGYDKVVAGKGIVRVPEDVLLLLVLTGGTLGALVAMPLFHHKTVKRSFRMRFWGIVGIQALLIGSYLVWFRK